MQTHTEKQNLKRKSRRYLQTPPRSPILPKLEIPSNQTPSTLSSEDLPTDLPHSEKYKRLITLSKLASVHKESLHTGNFVHRSRERWKSRNTRTSDHLQVNQTISYSSAVLIQSHWRRYACEKILRAHVQEALTSQKDCASWIFTFHPSIAKAKDEFQNLRALHPPTSHIHVQGIYYHLTALFLQFVLRFNSMRHRYRFIRKPPSLLRTIDFCVGSTCRAVYQLQALVSRYAALVIQCRFRQWRAKRELWARQDLERQHQAARSVQSRYRRHRAIRFAYYFRRDRASVRIQTRIRCFLARAQVYHLSFRYIARKCIEAAVLTGVKKAIFGIQTQAAMKIQRCQRGRVARGVLRLARAEVEYRKRIRSPNRALIEFSRGNFYQACLLFQLAFEQGYEGSLSFWCQMGLSNFHLWEQTGEVRNLKQAKVAFDSVNMNQVGEEVHEWYTPEEIWVKKAVLLYYLNQFDECLKQMRQAIEIVDENPLRDELRYSKLYSIGYGTLAMIHVSRENWSKAISYLKLLEAKPLVFDVAPAFTSRECLQFTKAEVRLLLGYCWNQQYLHYNHLLEQYTDELEEHEQEKLQRQQQEKRKRKGFRFRKEEAEEEVDELELQLQTKVSEQEKLVQECTTNLNMFFHKAFHFFEILPDHGFYHGTLSDVKATKLVQKAPVGGFLIHQKKAAKKSIYFVKVKLLQQDEEHIRSLKVIQTNETFATSTKSSSEDTIYYNLHQVLHELPPASGIQLRCGVGCFSKPIKGKKKFQEITFPLLCEDWLARPQTWLSFIRSLDSILAYSFSKQLSRYVLELESENPNPQIRCECQYYIAKSLHGINQMVNGLVKLQAACGLASRELQAHECAGFVAELNGVRKAWTRQCTFSQAFDLYQKLERMVKKGYELEPFAASTFGNPTNAALLLQLVANDNYVGDLYYYQTLASCHVHAFQKTFEQAHLHEATRAFNLYFEAQLFQFPPENVCFQLKQEYQIGLACYEAREYDLAYHVFTTLQASPSLDELMTPSFQAIVHIKLAFVCYHLQKYDEGYLAFTKVMETQAMLSGVQQDYLSSYSLADFYFLHGYFHSLHTSLPFEELPSFHTAHELTLAKVKKLVKQEKEYMTTLTYRLEYTNAISIHIRQTTNIHLPSILGSKPSIAITNLRAIPSDVSKVKPNAKRTIAAPTWESLNPEWNENVIVPIETIDSILLVQFINRYKMRERVLGFCFIHVKDILEASNGCLELALYPLQILDPVAQTFRIRSTTSALFASLETIKVARHRVNYEASYHRTLQALETIFIPSKEVALATIELEFQCLYTPIVRTRELQHLLHLPFSFNEWICESYVWSSIGLHLIESFDYPLAIEFYMQAITRATKVNQAETDDRILMYKHCAQAYRGNCESQQALKWLNQALELAMTHCSKFQPQLIEVMHALTYPSHQYAKDLKAYQAISHNQWVKKQQDQDPVEGIDEEDEQVHSEYYYNEVTKDYSFKEPLAYEPPCPGPTKAISTIAIGSKEVKDAVERAKATIKELQKADKDHWLEIFDDESDKYYYQSQKNFGLVSLTKPATYVMTRPENDLIAVIKLQLAYKKHFALLKHKKRMRQLWQRGFHIITFLQFVGYCVAYRKDHIEAYDRMVLYEYLELTLLKAKGVRAADFLASDPYVIAQLINPFDLVQQEKIQEHLRQEQEREEVDEEEGTMDIFENRLRLALVENRQQTKVRKRTVNPEWNTTFYFEYWWRTTKKAIEFFQPSFNQMIKQIQRKRRQAARRALKDKQKQQANLQQALNDDTIREKGRHTEGTTKDGQEKPQKRIQADANKTEEDAQAQAKEQQVSEQVETIDKEENREALKTRDEAEKVEEMGQKIEEKGEQVTAAEGEKTQVEKELAEVESSDKKHDQEEATTEDEMEETKPPNRGQGKAATDEEVESSSSEEETEEEEDDEDDDDDDDEFGTDIDGPVLELIVMDHDEGTDNADDFLGFASIPISSLDHGRAISAALKLRDQDGYDSPRSRGEIFIRVQWIGPPDRKLLREACKQNVLFDLETLSESTDENAPELDDEDMESVFLPPEKPVFGQDLEKLVETIHFQMKKCCEDLVDVFIFVEQLSKLDKMLVSAEDENKAEEAKSYQLRIVAVIKESYREMEIKANDQLTQTKQVIAIFHQSTQAIVTQYVQDARLEPETPLNTLFIETEDFTALAQDNYQSLKQSADRKIECLRTWENQLTQIKSYFEVPECIERDVEEKVDEKTSIEFDLEAEICKLRNMGKGSVVAQTSAETSAGEAKKKKANKRSKRQRR